MKVRFVQRTSECPAIVPQLVQTVIKEIFRPVSHFLNLLTEMSRQLAAVTRD